MPSILNATVKLRTVGTKMCVCASCDLFYCCIFEMKSEGESLVSLWFIAMKDAF